MMNLNLFNLRKRKAGDVPLLVRYELSVEVSFKTYFFVQYEKEIKCNVIKESSKQKWNCDTFLPERHPVTMRVYVANPCEYIGGKVKLTITRITDDNSNVIEHCNEWEVAPKLDQLRWVRLSNETVTLA